MKQMLLTPFNSTNPWFWGMDLKLIKNGRVIEPYQTKSELPTEFDFFNLWCGKDPVGARQYYGLEYI